MEKPLIGITVDRNPDRYILAPTYVNMVHDAGGIPILLPCHAKQAIAYVDRCDAIVFSGGDDPIMESFGTTTHPNATPVHEERQQFECALLDALAERPQVPVLAICLGMQFLGLHRGGELDQHLPETLPTHADHWDRGSHSIEGRLGNGVVHSHHRQALSDAGSLTVVARAHDGVIEAVIDPACDFCLGVQWHPERTDDHALGQGLFNQLVSAVPRHARRSSVIR